MTENRVLLAIGIAVITVWAVWYYLRRQAQKTDFLVTDGNGYDAFVYNAAARYDVPAAWVFAVIETESSGNPDAVNQADPSGAWGLMQVLYNTAVGMGYSGQPEGLLDPATNIDYGTRYLGQLRRQYGTFPEVYSAYNSGSPTKYIFVAKVRANVARAIANLRQIESEEQTA